MELGTVLQWFSGLRGGGTGGRSGAGAVVLVILGIIDAGYSGDWSRIGVLKPQQEQLIQSFVVALGFFHIFCAGVAAYVASSKGLDAPKSVAKVCWLL